MRRYQIVNDANSKSTSAVMPSDYVDNRTLGAGVAEAFAVPAGAAFVRLRGKAPFWVNTNAVAANPGTDIADGTASVFVAYEHVIAVPPACTAVGVVSETTNTISAEWFA